MDLVILQVCPTSSFFASFQTLSKEQAGKLLQDEKWEEAQEKYEQLLKLDPGDDISRSMYEKIINLTKSESILITLADTLDNDARRNGKLNSVETSITAGESIFKLANTQRFKIIRAKYSLYRSESDLHKWRVFAWLAPQNRLNTILRTTRNILSPNDPALRYVDDQLKRLRPARSIVFIFLFLFALYGLFRSSFGLFAPIVSSTPTLTNAPATTVITNPSEIPTISTITVMPGTPTLTPSLTIPAPSTTAPLDIGYIEADLIHPQDQPNGKWIGELKRNEPITILEQKVVVGDQWYLVQWENETTGEVQQGWILSRYVTIGLPPQ